MLGHCSRSCLARGARAYLRPTTSWPGFQDSTVDSGACTRATRTACRRWKHQLGLPPNSSRPEVVSAAATVGLRLEV
jgi:hypothetical protein